MKQKEVMQALTWYEVVGKNVGSVTIPLDELQAISKYIRDQDILINTWCERFEDTQEKWEKAYDELEGKYHELVEDFSKFTPQATVFDAVIARLELEVDEHNQYIEDLDGLCEDENAYGAGLVAALDIVKNMKGETT